MFLPVNFLVFNFEVFYLFVSKVQQKKKNNNNKVPQKNFLVNKVPQKKKKKKKVRTWTLKRQPVVYCLSSWAWRRAVGLVFRPPRRCRRRWGTGPWSPWGCGRPAAPPSGTPRWWPCGTRSPAGTCGAWASSCHRTPSPPLRRVKSEVRPPRVIILMTMFFFFFLLFLVDINLISF